MAGGYPLVLVDWIDSCENTVNSDQDLVDLPSPTRIFQTGFMVQSEEDYVVIAGGAQVESNTVDYAIAIPRCAITIIRYLTVCPGPGGGD